MEAAQPSHPSANNDVIKGSNSENELDPKIPSSEEKKKTPLLMKVYGILCVVDGVLTIPLGILFVGLVAWALFYRPDLISVSSDPTLATVLPVVSFIVIMINAGFLIGFGISLLKNHRRNAARWSYVLIVLTILRILLDIMLQGLGEHLIAPAIQLLILLVISVTVDPSLIEERELKRKLRSMEDRDAIEEGTLGRDPEGKGYIELNFFNLFWVFVVCSVLGLLIETVQHMVVVDPGVYQDRAGMLFGPFSPIYGMGAVICGMETEHLMVQGVKRLHDSVWKIEGDRIVAGTYSTAVMAAGGNISLKEVNTKQLKLPLELLRKAGANVREEEFSLHISMKDRPKALSVCTGPYPEFPTDLQSPFMAFLACAKGESRIREQVFEDRFGTAAALRKMGADITCKGKDAWVRGVYPLKGARVKALDLRGGAALAVAALGAEGKTVIEDCSHIVRGYEDICRDINALGGKISWMESDTG